MGTSNLLVNINPTAVFALGDNQYEDGALAKYMAIYDPTWGRLKGITHPVPGNHDYLTSGAAGYFGYFGTAAGNPGQGYYSYNLGAWHLIALNSNCGSAGGCGSGSPQESWLEKDLKANAHSCILAYWHHPRFSSGMFGNETISQAFVNDLYAAHADIIMSGHDHDYERFALQDPNGLADPMGLRQFVVGTGGKNHTALVALQPNSQAFDDTTFGVLKLTLHPGSYDWQFVPVAGSSFTDSGTEACHNLPVPTPTVAATRTPRPTRTPTPSPVLDPKRIFLPFVKR